MKIEMLVIRVYNNNTMDVEINATKTIFTKKSEENSWLLFAKKTGLKEVFFKREKNGDRVYFYN